MTYDDLKGIGLDVEIDKNILHSIAADEVPKCPGMKYKHYAPNAEVTVELRVKKTRCRVR